MSRSIKLSSLSELKNNLKKKIIYSYKRVIKEIKKDGGQQILLQISVRLLWLFLILRIIVIFVSKFHFDILPSTSISLTILILIELLLQIATPKWVSDFVLGNHFNNFTGNLLQCSVAFLILVNFILFIYPGILIKLFNKAIKKL